MSAERPAYQSIEYAQETVANAMGIFTAIVLARELTKVDKPDGSPVTNGDLAVDEYFHSRYPAKVLRSEERPRKPPGRWSKFYADLDPIDDTIGTWNAYLSWLDLSEDVRPPLPVCDAAVSVGGSRSGLIHPGNPRMAWGVVGMPLAPDYPRMYAAKRGGLALCINMLSGAKERLTMPKIVDGARQVVIASQRTVDRYGEGVERAGFTMMTSGLGGVTNGLCVIDNNLFRELKPGLLRSEDVIVGNLMGGHDWDIAPLLAFGKTRQLGSLTITGVTGRARTLGVGERAALTAADVVIHKRLLPAVN